MQEGNRQAEQLPWLYSGSWEKIVTLSCAIPRGMPEIWSQVSSCSKDIIKKNGYPKYQVVFFLTDTLLGSKVWLDLYHLCLNTHIVTELWRGQFLLFHASDSCFKSHKKRRFAIFIIAFSTLRQFRQSPCCFISVIFLILLTFLRQASEYILYTTKFILWKKTKNCM